MPSRTYKHLDFSIPKQVRDNAQKGLDLRREYGFGGTKVGEGVATLLAHGGEVGARKARHIAGYFPRHAHDNLDQQGQRGEKPSRGYIAWLLWGGDAGRSWSEKLVQQMDAGDEGGKAQ